MGKVQEWMAKKAQEDALLPEEPPLVDNAPVTSPPLERQNHESGAGEKFDAPISPESTPYNQESASADKAKAEKLAAAAQKCESAAVQEILDRALAAKLAATLQPTTNVATPISRPAAASATIDS